jgi:hypothetical protein
MPSTEKSYVIDIKGLINSEGNEKQENENVIYCLCINNVQ